MISSLNLQYLPNESSVLLIFFSESSIVEKRLMASSRESIR